MVTSGGVHTPAPTLKTWAEIQAYTDASALLTELNTYPTEYYNMINEKGYMHDPCGTSMGVSYICTSSGSDFTKIANKYWAYNDYSTPLQWSTMDSTPCPV